jgi:hypothetical protein
VSRRSATRVAWTMWFATLMLALVHIGLLAATDSRYADDVTPAFVADWVAALIAFQAFATVGAMVAARKPENPIGWLFCLSALFAQLGNAGGAWVTFAYDHGLRGDVLGSIVFGPSWFVGAYLGIVAPLFLFPDGRPLTRRWRPVVAVALLWPAVTMVAVWLTPGKLELHPTRENPIGIDLGKYALFAFAPVLLALVALALVSLILRYRRSHGVERQQLRVFVLTTSTVVTVLVLLGLGSNLGGPVGRVLANVGDFVILWLIALIPISMGVAILRYRLYDLDRVVSRTLVYGSLTVILGAAYVGLVLAGQWVFSSFAGGSNLAVAVSTLAVAALFLPLRARIQRVVDRRFYRRRYDAQRTLETFALRVREEVDLDALSSELAAVVDETMQPAHVAVWRRTVMP